MKAAFLTGKGVIEVKEIPCPAIDKGGILVAVKRAAICRTDLKMMQTGQRDLILPRILGHEGAGEVIASLNPEFREGDIVSIYPGLYCGKCIFCRTGHTARCESIRIYGFNEDGFFRSVMPFKKEEIKSLVPLTHAVSLNMIALAEPLACCISALKKVRPERMGRALIIGAGAMGSIFAALLVSQGWEHITITDKDPLRLRKELPPGIERINVRTESLIPALKRAGLYGDTDLIIPCCPDALSWPFLEIMRPGGGVIFFSGGTAGKSCISIDMNIAHYMEIILAGSYGCNRDDFVSAIRMISEGNIDLGFFDFYNVSLESIMDGMDRLRKRKVKKVIINSF